MPRMDAVVCQRRRAHCSRLVIIRDVGFNVTFETLCEIFDYLATFHMTDSHKPFRLKQVNAYPVSRFSYPFFPSGFFGKCVRAHSLSLSVKFMCKCLQRVSVIIDKQHTVLTDESCSRKCRFCVCFAVHSTPLLMHYEYACVVSVFISVFALK